MATSIDSPTVRPNVPVFWGTQFRVAVVLTVWLALIMALGAAGAFVTPTGTPPLPIAIGFAAPLIVFFAALWLSRSFRDFVMALDLTLISGIQGWRFVGFGFLALYAHDVLPGGFAWRAGLGDVAIGLTAPWVAAALSRRPRFAASTTFIAWNALGILDLAVAIATGAFSSLLATGAAGEITMQPMAQLPLVLIPAYLVPIFFMLHAASLFQARRAARDAMNWR